MLRVASRKTVKNIAYELDLVLVRWNLNGVVPTKN